MEMRLKMYLFLQRYHMIALKLFYTNSFLSASLIHLHPQDQLKGHIFNSVYLLSVLSTLPTERNVKKVLKLQSFVKLLINE